MGRPKKMCGTCNHWESFDDIYPDTEEAIDVGECSFHESVYDSDEKCKHWDYKGVKDEQTR